MLIAHSSSLLSTSDLRHPTSWSLRDVEPDAESCSVGARGWPSPYPLAAQAHRRAAPVRRPLPAELARRRCACRSGALLLWSLRSNERESRLRPQLPLDRLHGQEGFALPPLEPEPSGTQPERQAQGVDRDVRDG